MLLGRLWCPRHSAARIWDAGFGNHTWCLQRLPVLSVNKKWCEHLQKHLSADAGVCPHPRASVLTHVIAASFSYWRPGGVCVCVKVRRMCTLICGLWSHKCVQWPKTNKWEMYQDVYQVFCEIAKFLLAFLRLALANVNLLQYLHINVVVLIVRLKMVFPLYSFCKRLAAVLLRCC